MRFSFFTAMVVGVLLLIGEAKADAIWSMTLVNPCLTNVDDLNVTYAYNGASKTGTFTIAGTAGITTGKIADGGNPLPNTYYDIAYNLTATFNVNSQGNITTPVISNLSVKTGATNLFSSSSLNLYGYQGNGIYQFQFASDGTGELAALNAPIGIKLIAPNTGNLTGNSAPNYLNPFSFSTGATADKLDMGIATPLPSAYTGGILLLGCLGFVQFNRRRKTKMCIE